jgi:hypothetical protein
MKKKLSLKKRIVQKLKIKLSPKSDRKVAPLLASELLDDGYWDPSGGHNGAGCTNGTC